MTDKEKRIILAIQEADKSFEKAGDGGTKCWLRDHLLYAFQHHKLLIVDAVDKTALWP